MNANEKIKIAENRLTLYLKAEQKILKGQSYKIEGLELTRANLRDVQNQIKNLKAEINALNNKNMKKCRTVILGW
ncbi:MAG: hypothetical protein IJQ99_05580 [Synergistaceae bacterium]|nr:hypothetical protein [Synergistaceae bacterium]MBQ6737238.1 hypothetical protein [Synergistaceae bacterium]MBR0079410.1 hypothetical protein [Synergistaceae bacterium]MBR0253338.1 hypothetical protein [Synergistaceae bacterium]MBR0316317.1 hypothetical protein [Synergistaceae bacterium]